MKWWVGSVCTTGGVLLGAGLVMALSTCAPPAWVLDRIPEPLLARTVLAGAASDIVESTRDRYQIVLYARPVPVDETICRVVRYRFERSDVGGFPRTPSEVSQVYAIMKAPNPWITPMVSAATEAPAGTGMMSPETTRACAKFRDFDQTVSGDYLTLLQTLLLLETARGDIARNRAAFTVDCRDDVHSERPVSCDGIAYLRDVDLKQISTVWREADSASNQGRDEVHGAVFTRYMNGHPVVTELRISTVRERDASDPRITAITISRDVF